MTLGEKIKAVRKRVGMSQQNVADALGLSSFVAISQWEQGKRNPKAENLRRLAAALGVSVTEFFDLSAEEEQQILRLEGVMIKLKEAIQSAEQNGIDSNTKESWEEQIVISEELIDELITTCKAKQQATAILQKHAKSVLDSQEEEPKDDIAPAKTSYESEILGLIQKLLGESQNISPDHIKMWEGVQANICKIIDDASQNEEKKNEEALLATYTKLNEKGQQVALERLRELTFIPAYSKDSSEE